MDFRVLILYCRPDLDPELDPDLVRVCLLSEPSFCNSSEISVSATTATSRSQGLGVVLPISRLTFLGRRSSSPRHGTTHYCTGLVRCEVCIGWPRITSPVSSLVALPSRRLRIHANHYSQMVFPQLMLESWRERERKKKRTGGWWSGSGDRSPRYSISTRPSSPFSARYSTQNGPWLLRGSFAGRLCLLSIAGVRSVMCHSATNFISSSIVNSRRLLVLYYHNPFFHKNAPFNVASILFNPKFFGIDQILHHNATL